MARRVAAPGHRPGPRRRAEGGAPGLEPDTAGRGAAPRLSGPRLPAQARAGSGSGRHTLGRTRARPRELIFQAGITPAAAGSSTLRPSIIYAYQRPPAVRWRGRVAVLVPFGRRTRGQLRSAQCRGGVRLELHQSAEAALGVPQRLRWSPWRGPRAAPQAAGDIERSAAGCRR